jgi:hypothetical protein
MRPLATVFIICAVAKAATPTVTTKVNPDQPAQILFDVIATTSDPCQYEVSESNTYSPLVNDVNSSLFSGSNLDTRTGAFTDPLNNLHRVFVAGTRAVQQASDGKYYSRGLQMVTTHYWRVSCGATLMDIATGSVSTGYPSWGRTYRDPVITASDHHMLFPNISETDRTACEIEPFTGAKICNFSLPNDEKRLLASTFGACSGTNWTVGTSCANATGTATTYSGTTQDKLFISLPAQYLNISSSQFFEQWVSTPVHPNWFNFIINTASCTGANTMTADCTAHVCLTLDSTPTTPGTCASNVQSLVFPVTPGPVNLCGDGGSSSCTINDLWGMPYTDTGYSLFGVGYLYTSGTSTTVNFTSTTDCNRTQPNETLQVNGGTVVVSAAAPVCSGTPHFVATSPINLDISSFTGPTGYPFQYYAGIWWNPRFGILIDKNSTTASNTFSIGSPNWADSRGGSLTNTSGGFHERCSQWLDGMGNYKCRWIEKIMFYNPTTGVSGYLGTTPGMASSGDQPSSGQECEAIGNGSTFWSDANTFVTGCIRASDSQFVIFTAQLTGNAANDVPLTPLATDQSVYPSSITWTDISGPIATKILAFDPTFDSTDYDNYTVMGYSSGRYVHGAAYRGGQDTLAYFWVYDMMSNTVVADWCSFCNPSGSRWSVIHGVEWVAPLQGANAVPLLAYQGKRGRDDTVNGPAYRITYAGNYCVAGCGGGSPTFMAGAMPPTCSPTCRIQITGIPTAMIAPTTLQNLAVGDVIEWGNCPGVPCENDQVLSIQSTNADITLTRGLDPNYPLQSWANGSTALLTPYWGVTTVDPIPSICFWDFLAQPNGPTSNANNYCRFDPGGGHSVSYDKVNFGSPSISGAYTPTGISNDKSQFPMGTTFAQAFDSPLFSGSCYSPQYPDLYEGHPSYKPTPWSIITDTHPNIGAAFNQNSATWVVGTLFKLTYNENPGGLLPSDGISYKCQPHLVESNFRSLNDMSSSATGNQIGGTTMDNYNYCIAYKVNECRTGSSVGDIYVNAPYLNPNYFNAGPPGPCDLSAADAYDLCFSDLAAQGLGTFVYPGPVSTSFTQQQNQFYPLLEQFAINAKGDPDTLNGKLLWGGWQVVFTANSSGPLYAGGRGGVYLVKVPQTQPPYDGLNRTQFSSHSVTISGVPGGTNNVIVRFGYAEYGTPTQYYCTQRRDPCVANSGTVNQSNPFQWPADGVGGVESGITGVSCASTCAIQIPIISGYVGYFLAVFRDGGNSTISTRLLAPSAGDVAPVAPVTSRAVTSGGTVFPGKVVH